MSKELFMAAHDELIEQYLLDHPDASWNEAVDKTADRAYDRMMDRLADMADALRDRAKYEDCPFIDGPAGGRRKI